MGSNLKFSSNLNSFSVFLHITGESTSRPACCTEPTEVPPRAGKKCAYPNVLPSSHLLKLVSVCGLAALSQLFTFFFPLTGVGGCSNPSCLEPDTEGAIKSLPHREGEWFLRANDIGRSISTRPFFVFCMKGQPNRKVVTSEHVRCAFFTVA